MVLGRAPYTRAQSCGVILPPLPMTPSLNLANLQREAQNDDGIFIVFFSGRILECPEGIGLSVLARPKMIFHSLPRKTDAVREVSGDQFKPSILTDLAVPRKYGTGICPYFFHKWFHKVPRCGCLSTLWQ